jgi:hypothetical protein
MISLLSVKGISRSQGRTCCAAAAYRAGEKIESEYTGETYDYTHKENVVYSDIMLPANAPDEYRNRSMLWNRIEALDKRPDARLATEIMIPLPCELTRDQQIEAVQEFCKPLVDRGFICDICVHNPPAHDDLGRPLDGQGNLTKNPDEFVYNNPHVHILIPQRAMDREGQFSRKKVGVYKCINPNTGEENNLTQAEIESGNGDWEKQFKYVLPDGRTEWMAKSAGEAAGYERISPYPFKLRYGKDVEGSAYISSQEFVPDMRANWERTANIALERAGVDLRVDMRSYKDQGSEKEAQLHEGPAATKMDRKADRLVREGRNLSEVVYSRLHEINREIRKYNHMLDVLAEKKKEADEVQEEAERYSRQLQTCKEAWISAKCHHLQLQKEFTDLDRDTSELREKIQTFEGRIRHINREIQRMRSERDDLQEQLAISGSAGKKKTEKQIDDISARIVQAQAVLQNEYAMFGYKSPEGFQKEKNALQKAEETLRQKKSLLSDTASAENNAKDTFLAFKQSTPKRIKKYVAVYKTVSREQTISDVAQITGGIVTGLIVMAVDQVIQEIQEEEWEEEHRH